MAAKIKKVNSFYKLLLHLLINFLSMTYYFPYLFIIVITLLITIIVFLIINYKHTKSKSDKNNTIHNRYLDIFKKADVGLQIFNKEGYLIEYNETAKDMWGICDESKIEFNLFSYPVIKDILNTESEKYKDHIFNFEYDFDKENIFKSTHVSSHTYTYAVKRSFACNCEENNGKCGLAPPNNRFERTHGTSPFAAQPHVMLTLRARKRSGN